MYVPPPLRTLKATHVDVELLKEQHATLLSVAQNDYPSSSLFAEHLRGIELLISQLLTYADTPKPKHKKPRATRQGRV